MLAKNTATASVPVPTLVECKDCEGGGRIYGGLGLVRCALCAGVGQVMLVLAPGADQETIDESFHDLRVKILPHLFMDAAEFAAHQQKEESELQVALLEQHNRTMKEQPMEATQAPERKPSGGTMRVCCTCRRACRGSQDAPSAFGEPLSDEAQANASKIVMLTHTMCLQCFSRVREERCDNGWLCIMDADDTIIGHRTPDWSQVKIVPGQERHWQRYLLEVEPHHSIDPIAVACASDYRRGLDR